MNDRLTPQCEAEIVARQRIADLLWWSVPSCDNTEAKAKAEALLDAFASAVRAEALHAAADHFATAQQRHLVNATVVNIRRRRANTAGEAS